MGLDGKGRKQALLEEQPQFDNGIITTMSEKGARKLTATHIKSTHLKGGAVRALSWFVLASSAGPCARVLLLQELLDEPVHNRIGITCLSP